jgi:hypothetical protein
MPSSESFGKIGANGRQAFAPSLPSSHCFIEFVLFSVVPRRHRINHHGAGLLHRDGKLWSGTQAIDLVDNRLTDVSLDEPAHAALRSAYLSGDVVLTPNPWSHAMFADKRNLVRLTDAETLERWGVEKKLSAIVRDGIPKTVLVSRDRADELWAMRNKLFFKPAAGFGGRATYRGDKITRRVWQSILEGGYVAQDLVPPSGRTVIVDGRREVMKLDIRNYTYDGKVQLVAARLYQGQTTNFRTAGGGFALLFGIGPKRVTSAPPSPTGHIVASFFPGPCHHRELRECCSGRDRADEQRLAQPTFAGFTAARPIRCSTGERKRVGAVRIQLDGADRTTRGGASSRWEPTLSPQGLS